MWVRLRLLASCLIVLASIPAVYAADIFRPVLVPQFGWPDGYETSAWKTDGKEYISIHYSPNVIVTWDAATWAIKRVVPVNIPPQAPDYRYARLSQDGEYAVVGFCSGGYADSRWCVVSTATGEIKCEFDSQMCYFADDQKILLSARPGLVQLRSVPDGKIIRSITISEQFDNPREVNYVKLSPDNKLLLTIGHAVVVWDMQSGKRLYELSYRVPIMMPVAFSPDSRYLVTGGEDPDWIAPDYAATESAFARTFRLLLWDTHTGKMMKDKPAHWSMDSGTLAFMFSRDSKRLLSIGMYKADLWTVPTGKLLRTVEDRRNDLDTVSPFGGTLVDKVLGKDAARYGFKASSHSVATVPGYFTSPERLAFSPDGSRAAVLLHEYDGFDHYAGVVWDLSKGTAVRFLGSHQVDYYSGLQFSPDSSALITKMRDGYRFWNINNGGLIRKIDYPTYADKPVPWMRLSPDMSFLIGAEIDHSSYLTMWDADTLRETRSVAIESFPPVSSGVLSPNGRYVFTEGHLVDLVDNNVCTLKDFVSPCTFSHDSKLLLACERKYVDSRRTSRLVVWNVESNSRAAYIDEPNLSVWEDDLAFSPDDKLIAVCRDGRARLYTVGGEYVRELESSGQIGDIAFHPNGKLIAGCDGQELRMWDVATGKPVLSLAAAASQDEGKGLFWLAYTPDGYYNGSPGVEKRIRWRVGDELYPGDKYQAEYKKPERIIDMLNGQ